MNLGTQQLFGEGAHILYVNGSYEGDDELGKLMHDFRCKKSDEMYFDVLAERTKKLKESPEGRRYMGDVMEKLYMEGRADGKVEGKSEGKAEERDERIRALMETMNLTAEQAMKALKIPEDQRGLFQQTI